MNRAWSLSILFAAFLVMGLEASAFDSETVETMMTSYPSLQAAQGDNCGADGYYWLDENGQLIES